MVHFSHYNLMGDEELFRFFGRERHSGKFENWTDI